MATRCSVDFVPGAAYHFPTFAKISRYKHFLLVPAFLAGRGTGFDPQAVAGRCDPCDHVELVVVLPSFFEKVR